jgi:hypothetical protein
MTRRERERERERGRERGGESFAVCNILLGFLSVSVEEMCLYMGADGAGELWLCLFHQSNVSDV